MLPQTWAEVSYVQLLGIVRVAGARGSPARGNALPAGPGEAGAERASR